MQATVNLVFVLAIFLAQGWVGECSGVFGDSLGSVLAPMTNQLTWVLSSAESSRKQAVFVWIRHFHE